MAARPIPADLSLQLLQARLTTLQLQGRKPGQPPDAVNLAAEVAYEALRALNDALHGASPVATRDTAAPLHLQLIPGGKA